MRTWDIRFNTHVHVGLCNTDPEPACLPSFVPDVFNSIPVRIKKKNQGPNQSLEKNEYPL